MDVVADRVTKPLGGTPTLLTALLAMLCQGTGHAALPPVAAEPGAAPTPVVAESSDNQGMSWFLPPVRLGGNVSYNLRRDSSDEQQTSQSGLTATLNASTNTYIWQPWFARLNGNLGFTVATDSSSGASAAASRSSKNVTVTGAGQLSVLTQSKFPFEAYFQRNDNRVSTDLALANGYASQRYGFTQRYYRPEGDASLSWDRSTQTSVEAGRDLQDTLQLRLSHRLENHQLQFTGDHTSNRRDKSGEQAVQDNFALQHSYTPDPSISVESLANISRSDYRLQQGRTDTRLLQLSSNAFWRPTDWPLTVNGGVRVFAVETGRTSFGGAGNSSGARALNTNANLGVNYEFNRFTRINASANVNLADNNGMTSTSTSQSVSASFQPDAIEFGPFRYNWGTSANASNQTGGDSSERQLTLQMSHSLSRSIKLDGGSTISMDVSQGVSAAARSSAASSSTSGSASGSEPAASKQLTHSGSMSWDLSHLVGAAQLRVSASDSRALDGNQEFFQLVNFQASSSLPTSSNSSWTGNLTVQAVRQGKNKPPLSTDPSKQTSSPEPDKGFVTSSSGSVSYQNQRLFGVRRLRFVSDLRLNSQSWLPLLGNVGDQEQTAWANSVDYSIGRTQLRLNFLISRNAAPQTNVDPLTKVENVESVKKINKSIMFSVSRSFGNY